MVRSNQFGETELEQEMYRRIRVWLARLHGLDPNDLAKPEIIPVHEYISEETGCDYHLEVQARLAGCYKRKFQAATTGAGYVAAPVADFGAFMREICAD